MGKKQGLRLITNYGAGVARNGESAPRVRGYLAISRQVCGGGNSAGLISLQARQSFGNPFCRKGMSFEADGREWIDRQPSKIAASSEFSAVIESLPTITQKLPNLLRSRTGRVRLSQAAAAICRAFLRISRIEKVYTLARLCAREPLAFFRRQKVQGLILVRKNFIGAINDLVLREDIFGRSDFLSQAFVKQVSIFLKPTDCVSTGLCIVSRPFDGGEGHEPNDEND